MQRGQPARVAGVPSLQQIKRRAVPDLPDHDAVGPKAQGVTHQVGHGHRRLGALGQHLDLIGRRTLQLGGILDQHHPVAGKGRLSQNGVGQRGLARSRAADDQQVLARLSRGPDDLGLGGAHHPALDIVVQGEHHLGPLADRKGGARHDRHEGALEPFAGLRQGRAHPGPVAGDYLAGVIGEQPQDPRRHRRAH